MKTELLGIDIRILQSPETSRDALGALREIARKRFVEDVIFVASKRSEDERAQAIIYLHHNKYFDVTRTGAKHVWFKPHAREEPERPLPPITHFIGRPDDLPLSARFAAVYLFKPTIEEERLARRFAEEVIRVHDWREIQNKLVSERPQGAFVR